MSEHIHWHEGLFLQPHHLQAMQRNLLDEIGTVRHVSYAYPYGVVESRLNAQALENMQLRFDRLRVVMPGGLEVSVPENCQLETRDIKQAFEASAEPFTVRLGVPLWYENRANAIEPGTGENAWTKRRYRVVEVPHLDENTGQNSHPVLVRQVNARLLLAGDDDADMDVLPLLRIAHGVGEDVGLPRVDPIFIPPCLVIGGSPTLREVVRDLAENVEASRAELVNQLTRAGFSIDTMRGVQFEQVMRLRSLNRFAGRLRSLALAPNTTPFAMYLELRDLLGELAALHPDRDMFEVAPYDHDNVGIPFNELVKRIRALLRGAVAPRFIHVAFRPDDGLLVADLTDEHLKLPNEYFLGIRTREDPRGVAKLVEDSDQFKLMARSMAKSRVWGIKLAEERHPPLELPAETGLHYFRLLRAESERMWSRVAQEKALGIRWPDMATSDFSVTLYMTVPEGEG